MTSATSSHVNSVAEHRANAPPRTLPASLVLCGARGPGSWMLCADGLRTRSNANFASAAPTGRLLTAQQLRGGDTRADDNTRLDRS